MRATPYEVTYPYVSNLTEVLLSLYARIQKASHASLVNGPAPDRLVMRTVERIERNSSRMRGRTIRRVVRCAMAGFLAVAVILAVKALPQMDHPALALTLVLLVLGVAVRWGWAEALAASLGGGLAFDYYALPLHGFEIGPPEQLITLGALLCTALSIGWFAARANRDRRLAEARSNELARFNELDNALLQCDDPDVVLARIADHVVTALHVAGAAFFDRASGRILRSGAESGRITGERLRDVAARGESFFDPQSCLAVVKVGESSSLGVAGSDVSPHTLAAVAERVGVALVKVRSARQAVDVALLQDAGNLKSAILDALAHEIKGPLATVKVSVSTLRSRQPGSAAQQRELLEIADEELERIEGWIDEAIRMNSRDTHELRLNKAPHLIWEVVTRALQGIGPGTDGRAIEVAGPDPIPAASFDADLIEKVIRQLVNNAIKYSPTASPVRIQVEFTGAELVVHVTDSGCGIPADEQQRIFERYYRGRARNMGPPGTGLGLASAKCIMEAHGGEIWVNSTPGSGSTFHISLPVTAEASFEQFENLERR